MHYRELFWPWWHIALMWPWHHLAWTPGPQDTLALNVFISADLHIALMSQSVWPWSRTCGSVVVTMSPSDIVVRDVCVWDQCGFGFSPVTQQFPRIVLKTQRSERTSQAVQRDTALCRGEVLVFIPQVEVGSNCHHSWAEDPAKDVWEENDSPLTARSISPTLLLQQSLLTAGSVVWAIAWPLTLLLMF